jgi:hypothetical protein
VGELFRAATARNSNAANPAVPRPTHTPHQWSGRRKETTVPPSSNRGEVHALQGKVQNHNQGSRRRTGGSGRYRNDGANTRCPFLHGITSLAFGLLTWEGSNAQPLSLWHLQAASETRKCSPPPRDLRGVSNETRLLQEETKPLLLGPDFSQDPRGRCPQPQGHAVVSTRANCTISFLPHVGYMAPADKHLLPRH